MTAEVGTTSVTDATDVSTTEPSRTPSIGRASAVLTAATLAASGVNYTLNLLLARWMTPSDFGDANLIVTLMLGLTAAAVTLQLITAQRVSTSRAAAQLAHRRSLLRLAWWVGVSAAALIIASSTLVRDVTSSSSALPFVLLAVGLPFYLAQAVERGVLQGRLRFGDLAATLVIEAVTRLGVAIALVAAGFGVLGATAGITASFVSSWGLARLRVSSHVEQITSSVEDGDVPGGRSTANRNVTQATILLLIGQILINNGDVVLAKTLFDAHAAGVYSVVALIGRAIFFLSWSVVTAAFPMVAKADADERRELQRRAVCTVAVMAGLMTLTVALLAPPLTPLFFGADYAAAAGLFFPYAIATSLFAVANVLASLGAAQGHRRSALVIVGGGLAQTALLLTFANDPHRMVWLQVLAMGLLLAASALASRQRAVEASPAPTAGSYR